MALKWCLISRFPPTDPCFVPASSIYFHSELPRFKLLKQRVLTKWLYTVIVSCKREAGDLQFIFCSDQYLLDLNIRFLSHDYFTDVITFDYSEKKIVSGDIYISIDRVRDNAEKQKQTFEDELHRVMVHGVLHLLGYTDKGKGNKARMRGKEDKFLSLLS
jgi:probable rRNA maturation factor